MTMTYRSLPNDIDLVDIVISTGKKKTIFIHCIFNPPGFGDYLEIPNMQNTPATDGSLGVDRICGAIFHAATGATTQQTICSFATPFRVGVRFDSDETVGTNTGATHDHIENMDSTAGSGIGYTGFWLEYWQNTC